MSHQPVPDRTEAKCEFDDNHNNHNFAHNQQQIISANQSSSTTTTSTPTTTHNDNTATSDIPHGKRENQLDFRLQSMFDELNAKQRNFDFEKRVAEFQAQYRDAEFEIKKKEAEFVARENELRAREIQIREDEAKRENELRAREIQIREDEAHLHTAKNPFQIMVDQYYLSNGISSSICNDVHGGMGTHILDQHQLPTPSSTPSTTTPHNLFTTGNIQAPLTQADIDAANIQLSSKMDELTEKGKHIKRVKGILKRLEVQRDDLIRKGHQFDNDLKSAEDDIEARLENVRAQEDMIEMEWDRFQAEIKRKEEGLKVREKELLMGLPDQFSKILCPYNPDVFDDPNVLSLFEESVKNPIAMEKLKAIVNFRLDLDQAIKVIAIPDAEFHYYYGIIDQCNANSRHYGVGNSVIEIEIRCKQLSKQLHGCFHHYNDIVKSFIYSGSFRHTNPHNISLSYKSIPILLSDWRSDYESDKAPSFSQQLKLFFKTPNIASNTWIQYSGPGTKLWDIDPNFKLTVGSLCDPNGKDEFTSIHFEDDSSHNGSTLTSDYQISFKWE